MEANVFSNMLSKVMVTVEGHRGDDIMTFTSECGKKFIFQHYQDCCESVSIEDICGDVEDLVGSPILMAEEVSNVGDVPACDYESYTWTFYRFGTAKGNVTVRWLGTSNGYYGEGVDYSEADA